MNSNFDEEYENTTGSKCQDQSSEFDSTVQSTSVDEIKDVLSDTSQEGKLEQRKLPKGKRTQLEADYPSLGSNRSKGGQRKNLSVDDVVEETVEDDSPKAKRNSRRLVNVHNNYTDEIPSVNMTIIDSVRCLKSLQLDTIPRFSSDFGRPRVSPRSTLDPVPESQDDDRTENKPPLVLQSPRIKITVDFLEDSCFTHTSPRTHFNTIAFRSGKKYQVENETITEDNNENLIEKEAFPKKKRNSIHKFEAFIDKEEPPMKEEMNVEEEEDTFEPIKEETMEEDVLKHNNPQKGNLCADEVDDGIELAPIPSVRSAIVEEETINEIDEEKCGDEEK